MKFISISGQRRSIRHVIGYCILLTIICSYSSPGQIPAPPQTNPIAVVGATIHTLSGDQVENGSLLFVDGIITAVGKEIVIPDNAETIDAVGRQIYPGLIHAHSVLGLTEIGAVSETSDYNELGIVNPNVRAEVAYHPESEHIPVARARGITTAVVSPSGGVISGTAAAMQTDGWTWEQSVLQTPVALIVQWPSSTMQAGQREEYLKVLKESVAAAKAYRKTRETPVLLLHHTDVRWEAMLPVLDGSIPVIVAAQEVDQILAAAVWAETEELRIIILGGRDAGLVADRLKARDIPVILTPVLGGLARQLDGYDASYALAARLHELGVRFCIAGESSAAYTFRLAQHAAAAAAFGLPHDVALKAITLHPAEILGIDSRVGSIEIGKDATFLITDGNPLEFSTTIEQVYIQGRRVDMTNKHLRLYERYTEKYRQLNSGSR